MIKIEIFEKDKKWAARGEPSPCFKCTIAKPCIETSCKYWNIWFVNNKDRKFEK